MINEIKYPVGFYRISPSDPEMKFKDRQGRPATHKIEQVDGDFFLFPTHTDAERFIKIHGLTAVSDAELEQARQM
jgi:hypothetical protein